MNAVLQQRADILFLGDLGVARNKIGKLRQNLERKLGDEWFVRSNISVCRSKRREQVLLLLFTALSPNLSQ
jgi:hypothetical protein